MTAPISYCLTSDLEIALGGADVLAQLADRNGDGVADTDVVTDYLESGAASVRAAVEIKYEPEAIALLDSDSLRHLRDLNKWWSASVAWLEGGRGQAMPANVKEQREWVNQELDRIRTGERRLGRVAAGVQPSLGQAVQVVDSDPDGHGTTVASYRSAGFR